MAVYIYNGHRVEQCNDDVWALIQAKPESFCGPVVESEGGKVRTPTLNYRLATQQEIADYWKAQKLVYDPATGEAHPA